MNPISISLAVTSIAFAVAQGTLPATSTPANYTVSINVDLVLLQATVRNRAGSTVASLKRQDFEVREDGVLQQITLFRQEDTPVTVGLVIDHSGSMREKLAEVTAGAQAFVRSSNSHDEMFVVNFNERVSLGLPKGLRFSDSAEQLGNAIWQSPAVGTTALNDAIVEALERLQEGVSDKKVLIVISDGGDNASAHSLDAVLKLAQQSNAVIYTIGIYQPDDPDRNPQVLRRLAKESGGEAFFPIQLSDTIAICQRIANDIRAQYTIGYSSSNPKTGSAHHKIQLKVRSNPNDPLVARTRSGYSVAPKTIPQLDRGTQ
jgi:VWFA-related protein